MARNIDFNAVPALRDLFAGLVEGDEVSVCDGDTPIVRLVTLFPPSGQTAHATTPGVEPAEPVFSHDDNSTLADWGLREWSMGEEGDTQYFA